MPFLNFLGGIVVLYVVLVVGAFWGGYVLTVLWDWFIVPTFHIPSLSLLDAIGVSIVIGLLTHQMSMRTTEDGWITLFFKSLILSLIKPLFALSVAWIVRRCLM